MDKKYLLRIGGYIALAMAALILIVDILYQFAGSMINSVESLPVSMVEEDISVSAECYIVRSELPIEFTSDGLISHLVTDGTRVSAGDKVAEIYSGDSGQSGTLEKLAETKARRQLIDEAISQKGSYSSGAVDREIARLKSEIDRSVSKGDTDGLETLTNSLQLMLYIRELKVGNDLSTVKETLDSEIAALEEKIGGALASVNSQSAGYYFSSCDGYENYLKPEDLQMASAQTLRELLDHQKKPASTAATAGKIVTDYRWSAVIEIPMTAARPLVQGNLYQVDFAESADVRVEMRIDRMVMEYGKDSALIVLSAEEMPQDFSYVRYQTLSIVLNQTKGYRIPVSALRNLDGVTGVYVLRGSVVEFREVSPVLLADGAVLVDAKATPTGEYEMLSIYDIVIVRGKELYVGKIVDQ